MRDIWYGGGLFRLWVPPAEALSITVFEFLDGDDTPSIRRFVTLEQAWEWLHSRREVSDVPNEPTAHFSDSKQGPGDQTRPLMSVNNLQLLTMFANRKSKLSSSQQKKREESRAIYSLRYAGRQSDPRDDVIV